MIRRSRPSSGSASRSSSPLSVVSMAALVVRFRRSTGAERQQIKWFAYGAMIGIPLGLPAEVPFWGPILELTQPPLMFAGLGIGMFRYRLYDIDRLLNRTLVYGLLTVSLAAAYAAGVLLLGGMVSGGRSSSLVVAVVTLAVAAVFQPLRRAIQRAVDRRFNRRAYDAASTIEAFAGRLRQQVDADALTAELLAVVDHAAADPGVAVAAPGRPGTGDGGSRNVNRVVTG